MREYEEEDSVNVDHADRLMKLARSGRASRRQLLETGIRLGLASPVILSLIEAAPKSASASPVAPVKSQSATARPTKFRWRK